MSMLRPVATASGSYGNAKPALCPPAAPSCRYRRSATTKAPRKRTFIANMTKYTELSVPDSVLNAGSAEACMDVCPMELCLDCGAGNGNGAGNGGNGRGDFGSSGNNGPFSSGLPILNLPLALAVAAAVTVSNMLFNNSPSMALGVSSITDFTGATASSGSASVSMLRLNMVQVPAGTLTIPVSADSLDVRGARRLKRMSSSGGDKIVYGQVSMTADEMKLFADKQYHVREMIRV